MSLRIQSQKIFAFQKHSCGCLHDMINAMSNTLLPLELTAHKNAMAYGSQKKANILEKTNYYISIYVVITANVITLQCTRCLATSRTAFQQLILNNTAFERLIQQPLFPQFLLPAEKDAHLVYTHTRCYYNLCSFA